MTICLTVKEAARTINMEPKNIYYLAYMGYLEGWKIRGTWRFYKGSVEAYAKERNKGCIVEPSAVDTHNQGNGRIPSLFGFDDPADDMGRATQSVHGRRRMEHYSSGPDSLSIQAFKLMTPIKVPVQMTLFAEAV